MSIGTIFLVACFASYAIAAVMPTWRWLLGMTLVVAVLLYMGWHRPWIELLLPNAYEGPDGGLGSALALVITHGFFAGVVMRGLTLLLGSWGLRRRYVIAICVAGFIMSPGIVMVTPKLVTFPVSGIQCAHPSASLNRKIEGSYQPQLACKALPEHRVTVAP
jgi:hypothetical protein